MKSSFRNKKHPDAVVIGLESMQGLQSVRILARREIPVIAIAKDPKHPHCRTNVCKEIIFADKSSDDLIKKLEALGERLNQKAVLFPCEDNSVLMVSRNRQKLNTWYHIDLSAPEVIEMMMDKTSFYRYAQKEGFPIPETFFIHSRAEAEQAAKKLNFPCILKPSIRSPNWERHTTLKAFKVSDAAEFIAIYNKYNKLADALIAQEWIEGTDATLYSCNCYFNGSSEPVATFVARKLRQWPPRTGQSSLGEECRDDAVLKEAVELFRSVNYRGLGYVEIKRDQRSGNYFILEPNVGRPTGRSAIAEAGGVELLYTMYCNNAGLPLPANCKQKYNGVKWIHWRRDFQSAVHYWRRGELTLKEWRQSWRGRKAYAIFSWNDPAPFWADLRRAVRLSLSSKERKKRDHQNPVI